MYPKLFHTSCLNTNLIILNLPLILVDITYKEKKLNTLKLKIIKKKKINEENVSDVP